MTRALRIAGAILATLVLAVVLLVLGFRGAAAWRERLDAAAIAPPTGRYLATRSGRVFVQEAGPRDAIPVVLFHGTAAWSELWRQTMSALALALAKYPNVAIKATGAPSYSSEAYPFRNLHTRLRQIYDAFGPARMFWGTDITRMPCSWRQCVTLFAEELPWLRGRDRELVMGRAICDWLGWNIEESAG